ncbi:hypothetical protein NL676_026192 [Syzygium grande]|nr:hypothetical protein NL676_026192 [Syzygium grande]
MLRSYKKKKESYDARVKDNNEDEDGGGGDNDGDAARIGWVIENRLNVQKVSHSSLFNCYVTIQSGINESP